MTASTAPTILSLSANPEAEAPVFIKVSH